MVSSCFSSVTIASPLVCNSLKDFSLPMFLCLASDFVLSLSECKTKKPFALATVLNIPQLHTGFPPPTWNISKRDSYCLLSLSLFHPDNLIIRICIQGFLFPLTIALAWIFAFLQSTSPMYSHYLPHWHSSSTLILLSISLRLSSRYNHDFSLSVLAHLMDSQYSFCLLYVLDIFNYILLCLICTLWDRLYSWLHLYKSQVHERKLAHSCRCKSGRNESTIWTKELTPDYFYTNITD